MVVGAAAQRHYVIGSWLLVRPRMDFKKHPFFDNSQAADWFDVSDPSAPLTPEMAPFAKLIEVYFKQAEHLERKVLERIKRHAAEDLASRPHVLRNEPLLAPINDHGFKVYFEFFFRERTDQASAESDFWWGIIFCPYVFPDRDRGADIKWWNVWHLGWSLE